MKSVEAKLYSLNRWSLIVGFAVTLTACAHQPISKQATAFNAEETLIEATLLDYIEGTSVEDPERLKRAFHPDFNLYAVRDDGTLRVWPGKEYISNFKKGDTNSRVGKIISIDSENDIAVAKAEILIPGSRLYTDYFLLVKYEGQWKIIHKSYTSRGVEAE